MNMEQYRSYDIGDKVVVVSLNEMRKRGAIDCTYGVKFEDETCFTFNMNSVIGKEFTISGIACGENYINLYMKDSSFRFSPFMLDKVNECVEVKAKTDIVIGDYIELEDYYEGILEVKEVIWCKTEKEYIFVCENKDRNVELVLGESNINLRLRKF